MTRNTFGAVLFVAAVGSLGACAKASPPQPTEATTSATTASSGTGMMGMGGMGMMQGTECPMTVSGASVQTLDTADGMDMTFTTKGGDVSELRRRVRGMADHMNSHPSTGGARMQGTMMSMPPVHAQVDDAEGGAQMHVTPLDASRRNEMREHMQQGAQMMMQQHDCATGMGMMGVMTPGAPP